MDLLVAAGAMCPHPEHRKDRDPEWSKERRSINAPGLSTHQSYLVARLPENQTRKWISAVRSAKTKYPDEAVTVALTCLAEVPMKWPNPQLALALTCRELTGGVTISPSPQR